MQGFEVVLLNRTNLDHTVFRAIKAFTKRDVEDARNLLRIALQILLVRAVNAVDLASTEFHVSYLLMILSSANVQTRWMPWRDP